MPTMNEPSQLGHNMAISELGSHALSMSSLSSYLSAYPLSMSDLGLTSNLNLGDLNLSDHGSSVMTPSSPLTPMRPFTSKLFNHAANGVHSMSAACMVGMNHHDDVSVNNGCGIKPGSNLDPNATAYTPKTMGNGDL